MRVLFISYNGMLDPLGQSQVIPYLKELSRRGHRFTLLSFERAAAVSNREELKRLQVDLQHSQIEWHWLPYHQTPSLPATTYDVLAGVRYATRLVRDQKIQVVHARSHVPALMGLRLKRRFGLKLILMCAVCWQTSTSTRITGAGTRWFTGLPNQSNALFRGVIIVTRTESIWPIINQWKVCAAARWFTRLFRVARFGCIQLSAEDRARRRRELNVENRLRSFIAARSMAGI
jgi:hypothetical protein